MGNEYYPQSLRNTWLSFLLAACGTSQQLGTASSSHASGAGGISSETQDTILTSVAGTMTSHSVGGIVNSDAGRTAGGSGGSSPQNFGGIVNSDAGRATGGSSGSSPQSSGGIVNSDTGRTTGGSSGSSPQSFGGRAGAPASGAGSSNTPASSARIQDQYSSPESLEITINIMDGFALYNNDRYLIRVADATLARTHNEDLGSGGRGAIATTTTNYDVRTEQIEKLVAAVIAAEWRDQPSCVARMVDGAPFPPQVMVKQGSKSGTFSVSDADCATTSHSSTGQVMNCDAFAAIYSALQSMVPDAAYPGCQSYW
ncbi:MAG TPA: hypothetical protein VIV60_31420 [Polyangiaceae bacterium]